MIPWGTMSPDDGESRKALGHAIRVLRIAKGLNRKALAEGAGVSYPYLSEIEGGKKSPSAKVLKALADELGIAVHRLMEMAETATRGAAMWSMPEPPREPRAYPAPAMAIPPPPSPMEELAFKATIAAASPDPRSSDPVDELLEIVESLSPAARERVLEYARLLAAAGDQL